MAPTTRILLNVGGEFPCTGELEVTQLAPNRFRLEEGPFLMFDGGLHDIIEANLQDDGSYLFSSVVERSPWQMFDFLLPKELAESEAFQQRLFMRVEDLGGTWEIMFGGLVCLYLPQGIEFDLQKQIVTIREELRSDPKQMDDVGRHFHGEQRSVTFDLSRRSSPIKE